DHAISEPRTIAGLARDPHPAVAHSLELEQFGELPPLARFQGQCLRRSSGGPGTVAVVNLHRQSDWPLAEVTGIHQSHIGTIGVVCSQAEQHPFLNSLLPTVPARSEQAKLAA